MSIVSNYLIDNQIKISSFALLIQVSCSLPFVIDISTKVDSNPVHPRCNSGQYIPGDQDL